MVGAQGNCQCLGNTMLVVAGDDPQVLPHGDLWAGIQDGLRRLATLCGIAITKVKSHVQDPDVQDSFLTAGNSYADEWAGRGAFEAIHGTPNPGQAPCTLEKCRCAHHGRVLAVKRTDQITWFILRRLASVAHYLPAASNMPRQE